MPTDDEETRVTRATRKRLGSIDQDTTAASSPLGTPKKTGAVKKISEVLAAISENTVESPVSQARAVGTPKIIRSRKSVSESVDSPMNGHHDTTADKMSTPTLILRRKSVALTVSNLSTMNAEHAEVTTTPGRRVTRRTSAAESIESVPILPTRRVTRRNSAASVEEVMDSPALPKTRKRMSVAVPTETTLIEEPEEIMGDRSDSPADNTRSRAVTSLTQSPNSGGESKNNSIKENGNDDTAIKNLKVNLVDAFKATEDLITDTKSKAVKFDATTSGSAAQDDAEKVKFAKTPKTVKNMSYTNNSTIEVSKFTNTSSDVIDETINDSVSLDKSLVNLAEKIQEKGLPLAEESIMSLIQSPKVGKNNSKEVPVTPQRLLRKGDNILSSTPIVTGKASPTVATPSKAQQKLANQSTNNASAAKKTDSPKVAAKDSANTIDLTKRRVTASFTSAATPIKNKDTNLSKSWCQSVTGTNDKRIDGFGVMSPTKKLKVAEDKKFVSTKSPSKKVQVIESSSEDEEPEQNAESSTSTNFLDAECEEAGSDYKSNDSMSDGEKEELELNEVQDDGVSVDSEDSIGAEDADFDEYEKDSFLASDEEQDDDDLLEGSGDDLSLDNSSNSKSSVVQKKSPKKGGRIIKNPVSDSSDSDDDKKQTNKSSPQNESVNISDSEDEQELDDNDLEVVKRFQEKTDDANTENIENVEETKTEEIAEKTKTPRKSPLNASIKETVASPAPTPKKAVEACTTKATPRKSLRNDKEIIAEVPTKSLNESVTPLKKATDTPTVDKAGSKRKSMVTPAKKTSVSEPVEEEEEVVAKEDSSTKRKSTAANKSVTEKKRASLKPQKDAEDTELNKSKRNKSLLNTSRKSEQKAAEEPAEAEEQGEQAEGGDSGESNADDGSDGDDDDGSDADLVETSDDEFDDEDSDADSEAAAPKKGKKNQNIHKSELKPSNAIYIKEQRLHVLLEKCHEFVGIKKDELEEMKKKTKGGREAKRQKLAQRRLEVAALKKEKEVEEGRTVIKRKKKRRQRQKNPNMSGDEEQEEKTDLPSIVKKKMEVLEKRKQRNREKKTARKEKAKKMDKSAAATTTDTASPSENDSKPSPTPNKSTKQANKSNQKPDENVTKITKKLLKKAAASAQKSTEPTAEGEKVDVKLVQLGKQAMPVKITSVKAVQTKVSLTNGNSDKVAAAQVEPETKIKPTVEKVQEAPPVSDKKKKRKILDIVDDVEKTIKQQKQENGSKKNKKTHLQQVKEEIPAKPAAKQRLNILDESGEFSTAHFVVDPVTPEAKLLKQNSGFKECPITPQPINFKVTSIMPSLPPAGQNKPRATSRGHKPTLKEKLKNIQDVDQQLPKPQWKVKPTPSGAFVVTKKPKLEAVDDFIPLSTEGSTTQFMVATLESDNAGGNKRKKRKTGMAPSVAQTFKENAMFGDRNADKREPVKNILRKIEKKQANVTGRAGASYNMF